MTVFLTAFTPFSLTHGLTILVIASVVFFSARELRLRPQKKAARLILSGHVALLLLSYPISVIACKSCYSDSSLNDLIPLHLCNLVAIIAAFALITRKPLLCELTWFWGLTGTIQGLITPALAVSFPHPVFFSFFILHGAVVSSALLLPFGLGWRPKQPVWHSVLRSFFWVNVYFVVALIANSLLGTNFGFVSQKPSTPSLLDYFGPWPYYLIVMEILALGLFTLLALPFHSRKADK